MAKDVKLTPYRKWVLAHWRRGGWASVCDRLRTKKGAHEIAMLVKAGLLEPDDYADPMYRITKAGRRTLEELEPSHG